MENSSTLQENATHALTIRSRLSESILWTFILSTILGFSFFLCFVTLVLNVFFKTPILRENARYVLFVFLLLNDTLYLFIGFCLMVASIYLLHSPVPLCYILYAFSSSAFKVTPYNLAAMALEQYVAICHPLRHKQLCTTQRANVVFTTICFLAMIPCAADLYLMASSKTGMFSLYVICRQENLVFNPIQNVLRSITLIVCFTSVAIVIISTYVKIMQVAKRLSPLSSSASKAGKTVMIHAFQLLLCTSSLLSILTQEFPIAWPEFFPTIHFFFFTCVPRFLSPLIYGIRDELLSRYIKKSLSRYIS
ncbi:odorant receptor 131-2-like [Hyla sarda]|uniref:odorant receptor 131-2-like n=1 Tax=Hyla sarda TaxID=327740 RepID=UPI0024C429AB|nr:odorant receptor 131-2-like [Hyla sarda]